MAERRDKILLTLALGVLLGEILTISGAFLFMAALYILAVYCIMRTFDDAEERRFVIFVFAAGLLLRTLLCVFLYFLCELRGDLYRYAGYTGNCIFGDSAFASINGLLIAQFWNGKVVPSDFFWPSFDNTNTINQHIYGIFYFIFGFKDLSAKLIDVLLGASAPVFIYLITKDLFSRTAARIALILTMFFPSLVLWSITNLKEPKQIFFASAAIYFSLKLLQAGSKIRNALLFLLCALSLYKIRAEYAKILLASISVGYFVAIPMSARRKVYFAAAAMLLMASMVYYGYGQDAIIALTARIHSVIAAVVGQQNGAYIGDGINYRIFSDDIYAYLMKNLAISNYAFSITDIASAAVCGSVYFLFAPFPARIVSLSQLIALPQNVVWYILFIFSFVGIGRALLERKSRALFLAVFIGLATTAAALVSGNIGTAFRHRDLVVPFFLIFSSFGIERVFFKEGGR